MIITIIFAFQSCQKNAPIVNEEIENKGFVDKKYLLNYILNNLLILVLTILVKVLFIMPFAIYT